MNGRGAVTRRALPPRPLASAARRLDRSTVPSLVAALCLLLVGGCAASRLATSPAPAPAPAEQTVVDPPRRAGKPLVLIAMPGSAPFQAARKTLLSELRSRFDIQTMVLGADGTATSLGAAIERAAPTCIVLMNNGTVRTYREYQRAHVGAKFPPAIIIMTSYLQELQAEIGGATGISYEVPGVSAFVGLRALIEAPVSRVGVIHLQSSAAFIERERQLAAREHITLIPIEVSGQPSLKELQNAFRALRSVHHVNALWVLNDNRLLREGRFLIDVWQPQLERLGVPVIVGAAPLVNAQASFGTFAVLPDHAELGVQAAGLILELADDGWRVGEHPVQLPLSTINVLDVSQAREKFGLRPGALNRVDLPLE